MRAVVGTSLCVVFLCLGFSFCSDVSARENSDSEELFYSPDLTSAVSSGIVWHRPSNIYGPVAVPANHPIDKIASWMAKLEWDQVDPFYGAALPLFVTPNKIFFVLNYHELPKMRAKWLHLRASGKWSRFNPRQAFVAGFHPGYDLAVTYVEAQFDPKEVAELNETIRGMYHLGALEQRRWRVGVLGIPGPWRDPRQVYKNLLWRREADLLSVWDMTHEVVLSQELFAPSDEAIPMELRPDCPPVFLTGCYRVPMRTWGYSGGAFVVAVPGEEASGTVFKIAGIPSHFVPLTESTYIIPSRTVLKWGDVIVSEFLAKEKEYPGSSPLIVKNLDMAESFRINDEYSITALTGPLRGKRIYSAMSPFAPAGGETSGGGGETSGGGGETSGGGGETSGGGGETSGGGGGESTNGGGESSGGGGESSGGGGESSGGGGPIVAGRDFYFVSDTSGNVAGLVDYEALVKEVEAPQSWKSGRSMVSGLFSLIRGTKGVSATIRYRHGVYTENADQIYQIENIPIVNIQDFFRNYGKAVDDTSFKNEFVKKPMPQALEMHRNDTPGIFGDLYLLKFKPSDKLDPRVFHPAIVAANDLNAPEIASLVLHNMWEGKIGTKPVDTVSVREWLSPGGSVSAANFELIDGKLVVTVIIPRFGRKTLSFPEDFAIKGTSYYQYSGPIDVESSGLAAAAGEAKPEKMRFYGIANLEWDQYSNRWEFKVIMGGRVPQNLVQTNDPDSPEGNIFSNSDEIAFQVLSLPMRKPANDSLTELQLKPWEVEQMELGFRKRNDLAVKKKKDFVQAWGKVNDKTDPVKLPYYNRVAVNLGLSRSLNDYFAAFDERFDHPSRNPAASVCRTADLEERMRQTEVRMGLKLEDILSASATRVPRDLAARVQMLEERQGLNAFALVDWNDPRHTKLVEKMVRDSLNNSKKFLKEMRLGAFPLLQAMEMFGEAIHRAVSPIAKFTEEIGDSTPLQKK